MKPEFGHEQSGIGAEILCPSCGYNYLHQRQIEIFERGEDAANGLHVLTSGIQATVDSDLCGNPSFRRQGLKIFFDCEGCDAYPVLKIYQDKGTTYVDFVHGGSVDA